MLQSFSIFLNWPQCKLLSIQLTNQVSLDPDWVWIQDLLISHCLLCHLSYDAMLPIHLILYYIFLLYLTHRSTLNLINLLEVYIIFEYSCLNLLLQKSDKTRAHSSNWRISWDNLATSLAPYLLFQADGTCQVCTIRIWILDWLDIQVVCSIIKWYQRPIQFRTETSGLWMIKWITQLHHLHSRQ